MFIAINGPSLRGEFLWINLANSSLPTPLSPINIAEASVFATREAKFSALASAGELATKSVESACKFDPFCAAFRLAAGSLRRKISTLFIASYSVCASNGFVRKSLTPRRTLSMALFSVALPVIMMTSNLPSRRLMNSSPSIWGMLMSVMMRSTSSPIFLSASTALL